MRSALWLRYSVWRAAGLRWWHCLALGGITALVLSSCAFGARALSDAQIAQLVAARQIQPLDIRDINGTATAILYKDAQQMHCLVAWARAGIQTALQSAPLNAYPRPDGRIQPIAAVRLRVFDYELLCLTTNDPIAQQRASGIVLTHSSLITTHTPAYNHGNLVIWRQSAERLPVSMVELSDQDGFLVGRLDWTPAGFVPFYR